MRKMRPHMGKNLIAEVCIPARSVGARPKRVEEKRLVVR